MKPSPVLVRWLDSSAIAAPGGGMWLAKGAAKRHKPSEIWTVGFLVKRTKRKLVLVQSISPGQEGHGLVIPAACVVELREL